MEYIHLVGAEDVRSAANTIQSAASDFRRAANQISSELEIQRRFLEDFLVQLKSIINLEGGD